MSTSDITTTRHKIGIVVGGAENVWKEVGRAKELLGKIPFKVFAINDMIPDWPGEMVACTLHPAKLPVWLRTRHAKKHPLPSAIWSHRWGKHVTNKFEGEEWKGSGGLFATRVAFSHGCKVILCGVPMQADAKHFKRHCVWHAGVTFQKGWQNHRLDLEGRVKSMSGWTAEMFGEPTMEWIQQCQK